jgi:hypothetical protein
MLGAHFEQRQTILAQAAKKSEKKGSSQGEFFGKNGVVIPSFFDFLAVVCLLSVLLINAELTNRC